MPSSSWLPGGYGTYLPQRGSITTYSSWATLLQGPTGLPKGTSVTPPPVAPQTTSPANQPTVSGVEPQAYEAILYGKDIPLFAGAKALIGGRIIEGPYFGGTQADPTVSFVAYHAQNIVSHAFQYELTQIVQARLRGQEVWNSTSGYIATDKLPSGGFQWRPGHNAQPPAAQSSARHGSSAVAYAGGIISSWENLPLKPFGGIVPFPSVLVECSRFGDPDDGIPRTDAIEAILGHMGLRADEYEVDVTGADPAWLISNGMTLEEFLQQLRAVHVNYHITYTDKLRIIEPTEFQPSFDLTNDNILRDTLQFRRTDPLLTSIEKQYSFIDIERDYEFNVASAREEHFPHPTTDATRSTKIELPVVTTSAQALADIHMSLYEEMSVRNMMDGVGDVTLFGMEVGDGVRFADSDVIDFFSRVMETTHDFEKWTVDFRSGEVLNCFSTGIPPEGEFLNLYDAPFDHGTGPFVYSRDDVDLGAEAADRVIVLTLGSIRSISAGRNIQAVTINGVAATLYNHVIKNGTHPVNHPAAVTGVIAIAEVPTGTTGITVDIDLDGLTAEVFFGVFRLTGLASVVPVDSDSASTTGGGPALTLNVATGGIVIAGYAGCEFPGAVSFTGVSPEAYDEQISATGDGFWGAAAIQTGMNAQSSRPVSVSTPATGAETFVVVSLR